MVEWVSGVVAKLPKQLPSIMDVVHSQARIVSFLISRNQDRKGRVLRLHYAYLPLHSAAT